MTLRILALGALLVFAKLAAAEECGWLSNAAVNKAFPGYAPWSTQVGGTAGSCQFISTRRGVAIFGVNQMVHPSPKEALELVRSMKAEMQKTHTVVPVPRLGAEAFMYQPKDGDATENRSTMLFTGHRKQVVILGTLNLREPISPEQQTAAETLMLSAFVLADDPEALDAAANCPYFDKAVLKKLLPGKGMNQQTYGSNSCMANDGPAVVLVSVMPARAAGGMAGAGCTNEPVAALGASGRMTYACQDGNPHVKVGYVAGKDYIEFSFVPGHAPTAAEREMLVELARKAQTR